MEERRKDEQKKREYAELMALRTEKDKNKIKKMLKVTKSANRAVLEDAVDKSDTAITLQGPEQPDEDDYGYTSQAASSIYKNLMDKYKTLPEDNKFSDSAKRKPMNNDLLSTKDRVRAAILREKEDEKLTKRRGTSSNALANTTATSSSAGAEHKHRSHKNLYDPRAEREAEERRKREQEEQRKKMKVRKPPAPMLDFQKLLKLAEEKQHEPIQIEIPQKPKEPERLLTSKEKREIEMRKASVEQKNRKHDDRKPLSSESPQNTNNYRKPNSTDNGKTSKVCAPVVKSTTRPVSSIPDVRKTSASTSKVVPKVPVSSKLDSSKTSQIASRVGPIKNNSSVPIKKSGQVDERRQFSHGKNGRNDSHVIQKNPKQSLPLKIQKEKMVEAKPATKTREFPPRDVKPRDTKTREFPPRDVQRNRMLDKRKQAAAQKRRIIDDEDDSEYDSEMDDFIDDDPQQNDYSKYIKEIFGYDKSRYRDEDDDTYNMESNFAQQQREEFVSKKIGLMVRSSKRIYKPIYVFPTDFFTFFLKEDLEDMRLEAEEKKRKSKRKRL